MTAVLDYPAASFDLGSAYWQAVTASVACDLAGEQAEFATLLPANGDAMLRVQRLHDGPAGCHLDVHVEDVRAAAAQAERLGATVIGESNGHPVLRSPGGFIFCVVSHNGEQERSAPAPWPGGHTSLLDQLSIDISPEYHGRECGFWSRLTGWPQTPSSRPEFALLSRPDGLPLRLLLQRLDEPHLDLTGCTGHLDLACDDVPAESARHESLGASVVCVMTNWTTLRDPAGRCTALRDAIRLRENSDEGCGSVW